jgi:hypothetical protein
MHGIYNYIPETTMLQEHTVLQLQFMAHAMLFPMLNAVKIYISITRSLCAVSNPIWLLSGSSLISCVFWKIAQVFSK